MRDVAGNGEHDVVVLGVMVSTAEPSPRHSAATFSTAASLLARTGENGPAAVEQFGEGSGGGPECSMPAMGCWNERRRRKHGEHLADHRCLHRADLGEDGAFAEMRRDGLDRIGGGADGTAISTSSASFTASAGVLAT